MSIYSGDENAPDKISSGPIIDDGVEKGQPPLEDDVEKGEDSEEDEEDEEDEESEEEDEE